MANSVKTGLFLHMGPGLNCEVERNFFSSSCPDIDFWDQPFCAGEGDAFLELSAKVEERVYFLYRENGNKPLSLRAHSFGGLLALSALRKVSHLVEECHLYSTGIDYPHLFLNFMKSLMVNPDVPPDVKIQWAEWLRENSRLGPHNFEACIGRLVQFERFPRYYWYDSKKFEKYQELGSHAAPLHFETFIAVSRSVFDVLPELLQTSSFQGPVTIHLGVCDKLLNLESEKRLWAQIFPKSEIVLWQESGHFVHFETDVLMSQSSNKQNLVFS